jgi:hypothetical protein
MDRYRPADGGRQAALYRACSKRPAKVRDVDDTPACGRQGNNPLHTHLPSAVCESRASVWSAWASAPLCAAGTRVLRQL